MPLASALVLSLVLAIAAWTPPAWGSFPGANAKIVYTNATQGGAAKIFVVNGDGTGNTQIAAIGGSQPAWSPDGIKIAFEGFFNGLGGIFTMNADGSGVTRVTAGIHPAWSPDGTKLAFADRDLNGGQIWTVNTDGTGRTQLTTAPNNQDPAWSPDGTTIAFTSTRRGGGEVWVMNANGSNQRLLVSIQDGGGGQPNWSPDGTRLAYTNNRHLFVTSPVTGGPGTAITNTARQAVGHASWSPDGSHLVFQNFDGVFGNQLYRVNADGTGLTQLTFGGGFQGNTQPDWGARPGPTLSSIAVTPATSTIAPGARQQLTATGTFSDGSTADLTEAVTWASSNPAVATIGAGGLADALAAGTTTISATKGAVTGTAALTVEETADLAVAITDSPDPVLAGQTLTYTAAVTNAGPSAAGSVELTDTLPADATFLSATPSQGACTTASGTVTCALGPLAATGSATVTITLTPNLAGTITDAAVVTADVADPQPADNHASESTTVDARADLALTLTDSPDPVLAGQPVTYTSTVMNEGPSAASGVTITDTLPPGVFVSATASQGACTEAAGTVDCALGQLAPGAGATVSMIVVPAQASGTITDTASASAVEPDPNPANDSATESTTVTAVSDLVVTQSDSPDPVAVGATLRYTVTVSNDGPSDATGVEVVDRLPSGVTFDGRSSSNGCLLDPDGSVRCRRQGTVTAGSAVAFTLVVGVPPSRSYGQMRNTATASGNETDPDLADNTARESTTVTLMTGERIVFTSRRDGGFRSYVMSPDGASQTGIGPLRVTPTSPVWSPDGERIAFVEPSLSFKLGFHLAVMDADGGGKTNLTPDARTADLDPSWSKTGRIAFASTRDNNSELYVVSGSGATRLTTNPAIDLAPAWSPDGTKIAFASTRDGNSELYAMNADGTAVTRLTTNPAIDLAPAWSPDGTKIAFASTRDGNSELYAMNADGTAVTRLTTNPAIDLAPAWSPDGAKIAFASTRDGNSELYAMNADGTAVTRLTTNPGIDAEPDWRRAPPPS